MYKFPFLANSILALFLSLSAVSQQKLPDSTVKNLEIAVEGFKNRYHSPAIVVAIIHDKNILFSGAAGYIDLANKIPVTINSRFPIMSVTKTFTATMYMQLQQQKKINLFDEVKKYVPEYAGTKEPYKKKGTTLFQLATHTSGLPRNSQADINFTKQIDNWMLKRTNYLTVEPATKTELLKSLKYIQKEYPEYELLSYSDRHYSNLGYSILGIALERAAKTDYRNYIINNILKPLKMDNTGFDTDSAQIASLPKGYYYDEEKKDFIQTPAFKSNSALYAGGMYSTAVDLAKYISFQFDESAEADKILTSENRAMMHALRIGWKPDYPYVLHEGAILGFRSQVMFNPELKLGWVILTNANDFEFGVINNYFHKQLQPLFRQKPVTDLEKYVGTYVLDGGYDSLVIYRKDTILHSTYMEDAGKNTTLSSAGGNRFKGASNGNYSVGYEFITNEQGEIKLLNLGQLVWIKKK